MQNNYYGNLNAPVNVIVFDFIFFKYNQGQKLMTKSQFFSRVSRLFFERNEDLLGS